MQALTAKLYNTVTGDDPAIKLPKNKFVSWYQPRLPFTPEDFLYCAKGLDGATAEEIKECYHQAFMLSKLFDYNPDVSKEFVNDEMQQTMMTSIQDTI